MLDIAIKALDQIIIDLNFIQRYGSLVKQVEREVPIGKTEAGQTIKVKERFPISAKVESRECWENGRYAWLVPDQSKLSVAYFEELEGMRLVKIEGAKDREWTFKGRVRFVCWANIPKLNIDSSGDTDTTISGKLSLKVLEAINLKMIELSDPSLANFAIVRFQHINTPVKTAKNVFGRYTYSNLDVINFYPHDFFALDFDVEMKINKFCINNITVGTEVVCQIT